MKIDKDNFSEDLTPQDIAPQDINQPINQEDINTSGTNPIAETSTEDAPAAQQHAESVTTEQQPVIAEDPLAIVGAQLAEAKDQLLRLHADFENFRRRTVKEKLEMAHSANAKTLEAIIPIIDDFDRTRKALADTTDVEALKEGLEIVYNKMLKTLASQGLIAMETNGNTFDADLHEAVTQFPAPTEDLKGKVVDTLDKGYFLHNKPLRHAKVVVGI